MQTDSEFVSCLSAEQPFLRHLAASMGSADSDDLVQTTMVNAWKYRHTYHDGSFRGWLTIILRNNHASFVRRERRRREVPDAQGIYVMAQPDRCAQRLDTQRLIEKIAESLPRMSRQHRTVLIGACIHRRSYLDLADELQCPVGTIRSSLSRARAELRRLVGEGYGAFIHQEQDENYLTYDVDSDSAER